MTQLFSPYIECPRCGCYWQTEGVPCSRCGELSAEVVSACVALQRLEADWDGSGVITLGAKTVEALLRSDNPSDFVLVRKTVTPSAGTEGANNSKAGVSS